MIRILLVDDHTMIREALRFVLERDKEMLIAEAGDGKTALRMADEWAPDIVIMDVSMPVLSGIETTRRMRALHPDIKVLALSTYHDQEVIQQMLEAGAHGYISKAEAGAELLQGVRRVLAGGNYLCPLAAAQIASGMRKQSAVAVGHRSLSPRELQVATLLATGMTAADVADQLNISPNTVDVHRRNLMRKLELHNVVDLTRYAIRSGLISA